MPENNIPSTPLHDMNPLSRFSDRADNYAKYRPSYPAAAIDTILEGLTNFSQFVAADIGAGTGISSRLLAERGIRVIAIEPNEAMRKAALPHPLLELREGRAESTNLADVSVDLISCFQSFHWFDPQPTLEEFRRILKPAGRLAVVWNDRDRADEFTQNYSRLVQKASNNHPAESRLVSADPLLTSPIFPNVSRHNFEYRQELDLEGLIGRAMSVSYIPREGEAHEQLISGLTELYNRDRDENGFVQLAYCTSVYIAAPNTKV